MPDADLAALIRGEDHEEQPVRPPTKKHKSCPYCTCDVLIRAQKCKYCNGDLTAMALQGRDWQTEPATDGQKMFLKKMKIRVGGPMSKAQAAGLISNGRIQDPNLFALAAAAGAGQPARRGSFGFPVRLVIFLLLVGGCFGALKHFGKLDAAINAAKRAAAGMRRQAAPAPLPVQDPSDTDPQGRTLALQTEYEEIADPRAGSGAADSGADAGQPEQEDDPMAAKFRAEHTPPAIGSTLLVQLSTGGVISGTLTKLDDDGICLKTGAATLSFKREQLSDITSAVCYTDDYVDFRMAQHQMYLAQAARGQAAAGKYEAAAEARLSRLNAKRRAQQARADNRIVTNRKKTGGLPPPKTASERVASVPTTSGNMSMREWMEKYNTDNARLLARQARVKAYEQKASEQGLPQ